MDKEILQALEKIIEQNSKQLLTIDEACKYLDYKKGYIYQLTSRKEIPFIKPRGKKLYFIKSELDTWLIGNNLKSIHLTQKTTEWAENITSNIFTNE